MMNDGFLKRHIGATKQDEELMLGKLGFKSLDELMLKAIPQGIFLDKPINIGEPLSEYEYLKYIWNIAQKNKMFRTFIGMGYNGTIMPSVIQRNILENPSWYTSYTPYQAEISQGRLEALLNFQTVVSELAGLPVANASLLDESSACAEAVTMLYNVRSRNQIKNNINLVLVDKNCFPQNISVVETHAKALNINVQVVDIMDENFSVPSDTFAVLVQYPNSQGEIKEYVNLSARLKEKDIKLAVCADIMSLVLLKAPGSWGADVVVGSTQRFGIPMGFGGPHAAFFATRDDFKRFIPGRIIGVSKDREGRRALRMALQTREQHIKREKATSNICTAQALLAIMAGMYVVYHGKEGLKQIALGIHKLTILLSQNIVDLGYHQLNKNYFDTLLIKLPNDLTAQEVKDIALEHETNFRYIDDKHIGISLDETSTIKDVEAIIEIFSLALLKPVKSVSKQTAQISIEEHMLRNDNFLDYPVFKDYRSETELMRYIKKLERKDFSLTHSMISLGSCTMKLNAATQLFSLSWPEINSIHPFVPIDQVQGYQFLIHELGEMLKKITGFSGVSFQPNSGATGEYAGLLVIKEYHKSRGEGHRDIILIPASAHGTNPASAVMAGGKVVVVKCDENGNIDVDDLKEKAEKHQKELNALMVTYPSTHGVFEQEIKDITNIVHQFGGQVYMDGANMNAQVGITSPAEIGADVCHLNLHKTFAIPHGGGGPGVGPICVAEHLVEFLPVHPIVETGGIKSETVVASAPYGSASILTISHAYCKLLGSEGLKKATQMAILNANYLAKSLEGNYKVLYKGKNGLVAHEMILDCRPFKTMADVTETDIAKRLADYGFHAPTLSFPVHGTLMVEPTESESKLELDRFIEAMIAIRNEIQEIADGKVDNKDNPLKFAPHTQQDVVKTDWKHSYSREKAAFPIPYLMENKFWPAVTRLDDAHGDRNLICTCTPIDAFVDLS